VSEQSILIVGLGNPGPQYAKTRHNAGFIALDYFAALMGQEIAIEKMKGLYCSFQMAGRKVFLLKPQDYMNRSGECVSLFMRYFNLSPDAMLVVHDDLDLAPGRLKIVTGGGSGGHNGIRSLITHVGRSDFARFKLGIGHPRDNSATAAMPVERFVLSRFADTEWQLFQENLALVEEGIRLFIEEGSAVAMNRVNRKPAPPS